MRSLIAAMIVASMPASQALADTICSGRQMRGTWTLTMSTTFPFEDYTVSPVIFCTANITRNNGSYTMECLVTVDNGPTAVVTTVPFSGRAQISNTCFVSGYIDSADFPLGHAATFQGHALSAAATGPTVVQGIAIFARNFLSALGAEIPANMPGYPMTFSMMRRDLMEIF